MKNPIVIPADHSWHARTAERWGLAAVMILSLVIAWATWANRAPLLRDDLVLVRSLRPQITAAEAAALASKLALPAPAVTSVSRLGPFHRLGALPRLSSIWPDLFVSTGPTAGWLRVPGRSGEARDWARMPRAELVQATGPDVADTLISLRTKRQIGRAEDVRVLPVSRLALWVPKETVWFFWGSLGLLWAGLFAWHVWLCRTRSDEVEQGLLPPLAFLLTVGVLIGFCSAHPLRAAPTYPFGLPTFLMSSLLAVAGVLTVIAFDSSLRRAADPVGGVRGPGLVLLGLLAATGMLMFTQHHMPGSRPILTAALAACWLGACLRYPFDRPQSRIPTLLTGLAALFFIARGGSAAALESAALLSIMIIARVAERSTPAIIEAYGDGIAPVRLIVRGHEDDAHLWRICLFGLWCVVLLLGVFVLKDCGWSGLFFLNAIALSWLGTNRRWWLAGGIAATAALFVMIFVLNIGPVRDRIAAWRSPFQPPAGLTLQRTQGWEQSAELAWAATSGANRGVGDGWGTSTTVLQNAAEDFPGSLVLEQGGLVGFGAVIVAFLALLLAGFRAASRAPTVGTIIGAAGCLIWLLASSAYSLAGSVGAVPIGGVSVRGLSWGTANSLLTVVAVGAVMALGAWEADAVRTPPVLLRRATARLGLPFIAIFLFAFLFAFLKTTFPGDTPTRLFRLGGLTLANPRLMATQSHVIAAGVTSEDGTALVKFDETGRMRWQAPPEFVTALGYLPAPDAPTGLLGRHWSEMTGLGSNAQALDNALLAYRVPRRLFRPQSPLEQEGFRFPMATPLTIVPLPYQVATQRFITALSQSHAVGQPAMPIAAVFLDAGTGEVLASAFAPSNGGPLPDDPIAMNAVLEAAGRFGGTPQIALWDVPRQMARPPGSTWKVVTASAWAESGAAPFRIFCHGRTVVTAMGRRVLLPCWKTGGHGWESTATPDALAMAMANSCNVVFGQMGLELNADGLMSGWRRLDLRLVRARTDANAHAYLFTGDDPTTIAASGFGQGRVTSSVWEMAAVAAMPYNGGRRVYPYVALEDRRPPLQAIHLATATLLAHCLHVTSLKGSARGLSRAIEGCKTGTAQSQEDLNDAWLIGVFRTRTGRHVAFAIWAGAATREREGAGTFYKQAGLGRFIDYLSTQ